MTIQMTSGSIVYNNKIGIERVEAVELASKEVKRFSIEELKEIMILFKKMTKELKEYYKQQIKKL
jgi:hypothetical protein